MDIVEFGCFKSLDIKKKKMKRKKHFIYGKVKLKLKINIHTERFVFSKYLFQIYLKIYL